MMDQTGPWSSAGDGVVERDQAQLGPQMRGCGPADDHPRVAVDDRGEEQEPGVGAQVGDVGDPQLVRAGGASRATTFAAGAAAGSATVVRGVPRR
jgi:hypothetical protein